MKKLFPLTDIKMQFGLSAEELNYVIKMHKIKVYCVEACAFADPSQFEFLASSDEIFLNADLSADLFRDNRNISMLAS
tara:strand:- start:624 stop:857 length:234 start_codon:yes stop_codon:yes gene_type:complete